MKNKLYIREQSSRIYREYPRAKIFFFLRKNLQEFGYTKNKVIVDNDGRQTYIRLCSSICIYKKRERERMHSRMCANLAFVKRWMKHWISCYVNRVGWEGDGVSSELLEHRLPPPRIVAATRASTLLGAINSCIMIWNTRTEMNILNRFTHI